MDATETLRRYFIENRSRLIDLAAYLDRIDRSENAATARADFRLEALRKALKELAAMAEADGKATPRVDRIQLLLSDPTAEPLDSAGGVKSAFGAYSGGQKSCC